MISNIKDLFQKDEIEKIEKSIIKDRQHPIKRLIDNDKSKNASQVNCNTISSLKKIESENPKWINEVKKRLVSDDYSEVSSALGEIRAYGALLLSGMEVEPISRTKRATADFVVHCMGNKDLYIEVFSKQYEGNETQHLKNFNIGNLSECDETYENQKVKVNSALFCPFGKPQKNECVTENVISKLTNIKSSETQFSDNIPSILWLDFQDELWDICDFSNLFPISSWNGIFTSNPLWYSLYGWKDAPIFEHNSLEYHENIYKMRHEGRFRMNTNIVACFISQKRSSFIAENPLTKIILPNTFRLFLPSICWFKWDLSYMRWPNDDLLKRIEIDKEMIKSLFKEFKEHNLMNT